MHNSHRRSIVTSPLFPGQGPGDVPPIPIPPYPQQSPLGRKAKSRLWVFCWARLRQECPAASRSLRPFIPITGFISKSRNHPFEQIRRNQHHHEKVLFTMPCQRATGNLNPDPLNEGQVLCRLSQCRFRFALVSFPCDGYTVPHAGLPFTAKKLRMNRTWKTIDNPFHRKV